MQKPSSAMGGLKGILSREQISSPKMSKKYVTFATEPSPELSTFTKRPFTSQTVDISPKNSPFALAKMPRQIAYRHQKSYL